MSNLEKPECTTDPNLVSKIMREELLKDKPIMIARFGAFELNVLVNYLGIRKKPSLKNYIAGRQSQWWWDSKLLSHMENNAGFFPATPENAKRFSELMLSDLKELDILGSWLPEEHYFDLELKSMLKVQREVQNPFFTAHPWTMVLEGKKVLVVHPFADLIRKQFEEKREQLFDNPMVLPPFQLITMEAIQSLGGQHPHFTDWFQALNFMKNEIDQLDFDIALIGCGAYGFPLAAHVKRQGKKAVHLGGSLQLLFGIRGKRWQNPEYNATYNYAKLMNEHWVKPGNHLRPKNAEKVEDACYW